jgi:hypothetical protein
LDHALSSETAAEYEVGYGKPPRHARFEKKGQSGNPNRLSKPAKASTSLPDVFSMLPVATWENGKRRTISKYPAFLVPSKPEGVPDPS